MASYLTSFVRSVVTGRSALADFPYQIGDVVHETSLWKIHTGTKKADNSIVTVFMYETDKTKDQGHFSLAKNTYKKVKTIRHPNLLRYVDGLETETMVVIVTEKVQPLNSIKFDINNKFDQLSISWGLHQVLSGIKFLNEDCSIIHGSISSSSIYVDDAGEWKLFGFEFLGGINEERLLSSYQSYYHLFPTLEKCKPPEVLKAKSWDVVKSGPNWSLDIWYYGCLIFEIYNGNFNAIEEIKTKGNIPPNLFTVYKDVMKGDPKARASPSSVLQKLSVKGELFNNEFIQASNFLENFALKETYEKDQFFRKIGEVVNTFPDNFCKYKILPELVKALEFGNAGSKALTPLLKIGQKLTNEEYETHVVGGVVRLFNQPDRQMRMSLLENLHSYIDHLSPKLVNEKIFPQVALGFGDTSPPMREQTIKSMLLFAPKLNDKILNNELLRYFAKCQMDEEPGIRTNTTICLGKICEFMDSQTRRKVLIPAFTRAMKDPFPPARVAGIMAFAATLHYFASDETATKILPNLCLMLVDSESSVRDKAYKAINQILKSLEKCVKEGPSSEVAEIAPRSEGQKDSAAAWSAWKSTFVSFAWKTNPENEMKQPMNTQQPTDTKVVQSETKNVPQNQNQIQIQNKPSADGWGDDDDINDLLDSDQSFKNDNQGWGDVSEESESWAFAAPSKTVNLSTKSSNSSFKPSTNSSILKSTNKPPSVNTFNQIPNSVNSNSSPSSPQAADDDEWAPLETKETPEEKQRRIEEGRRKQAERKEQRLKARQKKPE